MELLRSFCGAAAGTVKRRRRVFVGRDGWHRLTGRFASERNLWTVQSDMLDCAVDVSREDSWDQRVDNARQGKKGVFLGRGVNFGRERAIR
jgi:hypothetical protein